ncbi:hypothetical protein B0H11DRAFT_2248525 [Mycena galericulata]|nr:hypothetical protein B0H11DRAFT_2248525 [Mycena galericulata]
MDLDTAFKNSGIVGLLNELQLGTESTEPMSTFVALRKPLSEAQYEAVAKYFGLVGNEENPFKEWKDFDVPDVMLPTSVMEKLTSRTIESFVSESATGSLSSGALQSLVWLFGGILRDRPENRVPETDISSDEGAIFCRDEMLFLVRELKYRQSGKTKFLQALTPVLCELFAVWHLNRRQNTHIDPTMLIPVHACLYDAADVYFLSYDGVSFRRRIFLNTRSPATVIKDLQEHIYGTLNVHKYTFALLLEGYYNSLTLNYERSVRESRRATVCPTTTAWHTACRLAYESRAFFQRAHQVRSDEPAEKGLKLLHESLEAWPAAVLGGIQLRVMLPATVKALMDSVIQRHERALVADSNPKWVPRFPGVVSVTMQQRKRETVNAFWASLPHKRFREMFESPFMLQGESFDGLSMAAQSPHTYEKYIVALGPPCAVGELLLALQVSNSTNLWDI